MVQCMFLRTPYSLVRYKISFNYNNNNTICIQSIPVKKINNSITVITSLFKFTNPLKMM